MLLELSVLHADEVDDNPWCGKPVTGEPSTDEDHVAVGHDELQLVLELRGHGLDQAEQAVATRGNVRAVLDVLVRPEAFGGRVVALVKQRVERLADGLLVAVLRVGCRTHLSTPVRYDSGVWLASLGADSEGGRPRWQWRRQ